MEANIFLSFLHHLELILALRSTDDVLKPEHFTYLIVSQLVLIGDFDPSSALPTIRWKLYNCMLDKVLDADQHLNEL